MKLHRIAVATAVVALVLAGLASPVFAADTGSVVNTGASVTGGDRTATLAGDIVFDAVNASHAAQSPADEGTSVAVNDLSATEAGWTVTIVASDLTHTDGVTTIPAANVSVDAFGTLTPTDVNVTAGSPGGIGSSRTLVSALATFGVGNYTQPFDLGLNVPGDSLAGSYSGTVTVTVAPAS